MVPDEEEQQATENDHSNGDDLSALMNSAAARRGTFVRRRKTCPVCRGVVPDKPVEMWDIKQMVAALVKSHLVDLPVPPRGEEGEGSNTTRERRENNTPNDPWRNIFRPSGSGRGHHRHGGPPPRGHEDNEDEREQFGWYDHEDGGVYRCVDCLHELWGGMCTGCERIYRGHETEDDDDEEEDEEDDFFFNDDDDDMDPVQWADYMFLQDEVRRRFGGMYDHVEDEEDEEDEDEEVGLDVVDEYNREFLQDIVHRVGEVEGGWSFDTDGEGGVDVESSDGFIDDEERMRSGGMSGVGVVDSEEEASSEPVSWGRLRSRRIFEEEEGTSGLDEEGSDLGIDYRNGWDGGLDEEIRRSLTPGLRRSMRRRTQAVESASSDYGFEEHLTPPRRNLRRTQAVESASSDDGLTFEEHLTPPRRNLRRHIESASSDEERLSPPPRRNPRLSWVLRRRAVVDSENGLSSADDDESIHSDVEYFQMRSGLLYRRDRD